MDGGAMGNFSLKTKIWFGFGVVLLLLLFVGGYDVIQVREIQRTTGDVAENASARFDLQLVRLLVERRISALRGALLNDTQQFQKDYQQATTDVSEAVK